MRGGRGRGRPMMRPRPMMGRHRYRRRPCCGCCGGIMLCIVILFLIVIFFGFAFFASLFSIFS